MRTKFLKYGKRMMGTDGQSEYFEASIEVGPTEDPEDCARRVKQFVRSQLEPEDSDKPLTHSLGGKFPSGTAQ